jgi:D-amino-acid dehydrogenase
VTQRQYQKIAIIGAGLSGLCSAYFLAQAGYQVTLFEQHGNVAEQASLGNSGMLAAAGLMPIAMPGLRKTVLSSLFSADSPLLLSPTVSPSLWRWLRKWFAEAQLERFRINKMRMTETALYGHRLLHQMQLQHQIDLQATPGILHLFRSAAQWTEAAKLHAVLSDMDIGHAVLDSEQVRQMEPDLHPATALSGAWHFPQDGAGNCLYFIKQLKTVVQALGVQCHFMHNVSALQPDGNGVEISIDGATVGFDAAVVAAGAGSNRLLKPLGVRVPTYIVSSYAAVAGVKHPEYAPRSALIDTAYKTSLVRIDERIRIAGVIGLQPGRGAEQKQEQAMTTLLKIAGDWYPNAANYNQASFWSGNVALLPDGPPLIGATPAANIFVHIDGSSNGWAGTVGAAAALADLIGQRTPEIDVGGLQLTRYGAY